MYPLIKSFLYNSVANYLLYNVVLYNVGGLVVQTILVNTLPTPVSRVLCLTR